MSEVIFCRPRHEYESYTDYWRLVELSDYPIIYIDELDPQSDNTYIVTPLNGEWQDGWQDPRAQIILWDMEWHLPNPGIAEWNESVWRPGVARVWASDKWYAEKIGAEYVLLGSHPDLAGSLIQTLHYGPIRTAEDEIIAQGVDNDPNNFAWDRKEPDRSNLIYDVAMMSYMTNRRQKILSELVGLFMTNAPNAWGYERHKNLQSSHAMLHIHQHDDVATVAPQRWALAAAYKMPLITESVEDSGLFDFSHALSTDYNNLASIAHDFIRRQNPRVLEDKGVALHQFLCVEHTFRKCIEAAL